MTRKKAKNLSEKQVVVVLVGHIDHGKSSILQAIKDFKILDKETGGITQHIGTYEVEHSPAGSEQSKKITFIDTPGHEAFSAMRARGAKVADIAILVVAADQGVQAQTKEAISHIKEAQIPIIVAINKIDRPQSDPERIKDELSQNNILVEGRGGDVPCVKTSAKTGKGTTELLEMILLVAELQDLRFDASSRAKGVVVESSVSSKRGCVATLLLERGSLRKGEIVGTCSATGKIKRIENFLGEEIEEARAGQGILVLGFNEMPILGEEFTVYPSIEAAKGNMEVRVKEARKRIIFSSEPENKALNLIIKTDVLGSISPIKEILMGLPQDKITLKILKTGAGDINLADVKLAEDSKALILGFRVGASSSILDIAERRWVKIFRFDLIYDMVEGLRNFIKKTLKPELIKVDLGKLKVLLIFKTDKKRQIIGARILDGEIKKGDSMEIFRPAPDIKTKVLSDDNKIGKGRAIKLEKDKKELKAGKKGDEVGILYEGDCIVQEGDILKVYKEERRSIEL